MKTGIVKTILVVSLFALCVINNYAQSLYYKVRIGLERTSIAQLARLGLETDHGLHKANCYLETWLSAKEKKLLDDNKIGYTLINDKDRTQKNNTAKDEYKQDCYPINYTSPINYNEGSMAGFLTYAELLSELDSMANLYPNIITPRTSVGSTTTIEGNTMWYVKISDNANLAESENQILYTAIHHAREPMGMQNLVFYMWYLLENYNTDSLVKYIVDHTELYFIPCINVDGYLYNELTDPQGGGLWRKNRRDNLDGTFGVDLNRNYDYNWGYDDNGSSPFTSSATYRGTTPFSEPETQLTSAFCNAHQFRLALNYHSFGNLLIYPWGYVDNLYTPDSAHFVDFAQLITLHNNYKPGTANQTVNYITNGSSDDWMYGEQNSKGRIFAFTPETGYDFWPFQVDIDAIVKSNMFANIQAALMAGKYATAEDLTITDVYSSTNYLVYKLTMHGLDSSGTYTVAVNGISNIASTGTSKTYTNLYTGDVLIDSIPYTLAANMAIGDIATLELTVNNGFYTWKSSFDKVYNYPTNVFADNGNNMGQWNSATWNTTTSQYVSGTSSITDSPFGNYQDATIATIEMKNAVLLSTMGKAELTYYARWELEPIFDYAQVQISDDNGINWTPLCGRYTDEGADTQDPGMPVYDGFQTDWVFERIDLSAYQGKSIRIRFRLFSDWANNFDGFYLDDININGGVNAPIQEQSEVPLVFAAPNPFTNALAFMFRNPASNVTITIYDVLGKVVYSTNKMDVVNKVELELGSIRAGVYTVQISNATARLGTLKIAKQ